MGVGLMIVVQLAFTHTDFMNTLFKSESLTIQTWAEILVISFGVLFVVEIKRFLENKFVQSE